MKTFEELGVSEEIRRALWLWHKPEPEKQPHLVCR